MTSELKPCPFCGGEAVCDTVIPNDTSEWAVSCVSDQECAGRIYQPDCMFPHPDIAIAAWNRRAPEWFCTDCGYCGGVLVMQAMCPECDSIHVRFKAPEATEED